MMDCREINEQDIIERYLSGELSDAERQAFEDHYFGCADCFEHLKIARALQENGISTESRLSTPKYFWERVSSVWLPVAAVAVLAAAALYWTTLRTLTGAPQGRSTGQATTRGVPAGAKSQEERDAIVAQLSQVEPPPYAPKRLREAGNVGREQFDQAMRLYLQGNYGAAIEGLQKAARLAPDAVDVNFYLGACYLLTHQPKAAIDALRKAISPDYPDYAEQAHYYLAKAYLQGHNIQSAGAELEFTLEFGGERKGDAERLKQQLDKLQ
jgi:tetratricopeptide (TPR) repeat protein